MSLSVHPRPQNIYNVYTTIFLKRSQDEDIIQENEVGVEIVSSQPPSMSVLGSMLSSAVAIGFFVVGLSSTIKYLDKR